MFLTFSGDETVYDNAWTRLDLLKVLCFQTGSTLSDKYHWKYVQIIIVLRLTGVSTVLH